MTEDERAVIAAAEGYRDSPTSVAFNALCYAVDAYRANVAREVAETGVEAPA